MGKSKTIRKFAVARKKMMSPKDTRVQENLKQSQQRHDQLIQKKTKPRHVEQVNSALFFQYNTQLGPPYHVLIDTNFINFSIRYVVLCFVFCCLLWFVFCLVCWFVLATARKKERLGMVESRKRDKRKLL